MRNFTIVDGLQSNQFNAGSYCRIGNGNMLFGGINGITMFRPETLIDNPYTPKPVINKLFVFNSSLLVLAVDTQKNINERPATQQLLESIDRYVKSDKFAPQITVDESYIESFLKK